jgi:hypothetical protein
MREIIGAFEIGVMPAPDTEEPISESKQINETLGHCSPHCSFGFLPA